MHNATLLTPFFLDQPLPGLTRFAPSGHVTNAPTLLSASQQVRLAKLNEPIARHVAATVASGHRAVSMAGDCCAAIGVAAGLQRAGERPILVWFDAHGDFNTPESTPSGFVGGMPLAMIVGRGDLALPDAVGLRPLPESDVILSDARDLDPGERLLIEASAVNHARSINEVTSLIPPDRPIHVHLDVDVIDPAEAPSMKYATPGGPRVAELCAVLAAIEATGRLVAVSLSAWDVDGDADGRTARASMRAFAALLGEPAMPPAVV